MKRISLLKTTICCLVASLLVIAMVQAQPAKNTILDDLKIVDEGDHSIARIGFTFPVRYLRHYPLGSGAELHIQVKPIAINPDDLEDLFRRESIPPVAGNSAKLLDVVYEGSDTGGRYLSLYFAEPVDFEVEQGDDYRSMEILVCPIESPGVEEEAGNEQ